MIESVEREGCFITVRIGDLIMTRQYADNWCTDRAERKLLSNLETRKNFLKPVKGRIGHRRRKTVGNT